MAKKIIGNDGKVYIEKKPFYKKWWFILLIVVFIAGAIGKNSSKNEKVNGNNQEVTKKEEKQIFKIGDKISTKNIDITINEKTIKSKVTDKSGYISFTPEGKGNKFIILNVTIKNTSKEMISLDSRSFQLFSDDVQYSPSTVLVEDGLNFDSINPGVEIDRKIFFDIPEEVTKKTNLVLHLGDTFFSKTGGKFEIKLD